jgi:hypothetical protein
MKSEIGEQKVVKIFSRNWKINTTKVRKKHAMQNVQGGCHGSNTILQNLVQVMEDRTYEEVKYKSC